MKRVIGEEEFRNCSIDEDFRGSWVVHGVCLFFPAWIKSHTLKRVVHAKMQVSDIIVQVSPALTGHAFPWLKLWYKQSLVQVTSPYGNTVHQKENATVGQFAFTTAEAGNYLACFWLDSAEKGSGISLSLDWKIGIATKDWDSVAKKEKIEGVELELAKLEAAVESIHHNLLYLKAREADMREVSEKTNSRVAWFSILSLGVCVVVSALQLWHLQGFFQKKKLI